MAPRLILPLALVLLLLGCGGEGDRKAPARQAPPNPSAPEAKASPAPAEASPAVNAADATERLLAWLDPDAVSVAYLRLPRSPRADVLSVVYGLPPRAEDLLKGPDDVDHALEAVLPAEAPRPEAWLGSTTLLMMSRMSRRPYVLRPLLRPRAEVIATLEQAGLTRQEHDPFEIWVPARAFPYRVVLLDGDVAAFIPIQEPGSGLPPLIAARDMPPSDAEAQLRERLGQPDAPAMILVAAGPMLHFDLDADVLMVRFEALRGPDGSLDGQVALQLDGDPGPAAQTMEDRKAPEQSDRVQALVDRAAYLVDAGVVVGRLQLPPDDAALLFHER